MPSAWSIVIVITINGLINKFHGLIDEALYGFSDGWQGGQKSEKINSWLRNLSKSVSSKGNELFITLSN